jgi:hypothetical protein
VCGWVARAWRLHCAGPTTQEHIARKNHKKASDPKLAVHRETLRRLAGADLVDVHGGAASWACDNQSFGFLCTDPCGGTKSCAE